MKRTPAVLALAVLFALVCACSNVATRDGAAATQPQSLAPQRQQTPQQQQQSPQPTPRPNLCNGQRSPLPAPTSYVSDFAQVIDAPTERQLESRLAGLRKSTRVEFAVVTVETTAGRDIFDYALDVACGWGIGPFKENDPVGGVLLLVAVEDRRWRVHVSRSLESTLPDKVVGEIGARMTEHFKRGDFGKGISAAVEEHIVLLASDAKTGRRKPTP